jgi:DNA-directed RNA polymerase specialized sigma24 family protein
VNAGKAVEAEEPDAPVPLTRRRPNRETLKRSAATEAEIGRVLQLSQDERLRRVGIRERQHPEFMTEECLVYFLRDAQARADDRALLRFWTHFVSRVQGRIVSKLAKLGPDHVLDGYIAVLSDIGQAILDPETDRGDFLQVSFWTVIDRRATSEFRSQRRAKLRAQTEVSLTELAGEEGAGAYPDDGEGRARIPRSSWEDDRPSALDNMVTAEDKAAASRALASLPPLVRQAFILRHYEGWQIDSNDPTEMTISKALKKSPRQIGNYLKEAETRLRAWREEEAR